MEIMILLASQSPQRRMLLERSGIPFEVVATLDDEGHTPSPLPSMLAIERARLKALNAEVAAHRNALERGEAWVLAADTVVALGRECIGKPADRGEAVRILMKLQGTRHTVYTGHCVCIPGPQPLEAVALAMTQVTMRPMSPSQIQAYVDSGEADGRAGAYAIQESADQFVEDIQGDLETVIGLHVATAQRLVEQVRAAWQRIGT